VLAKRGDSGIPNDLARLAGRRLVLIGAVALLYIVVLTIVGYVT